MLSAILAILTVILILVSLFLVLVVLAQKSKDGGMGAALGGGAAEAAFGAETSNVLSKSTIYAAVLFFVLAFIVYLGRIYEQKHPNTAGGALPAISAPTSPVTAPVTTAPAPGGSATTPAPAVSIPLTPSSKSPAAATPPANSTAAPASTPAPQPAAPEPAKKP